MANHGVVRKDKLLAGYHGNLESVKHTADLDNGSVVHIGDLAAGEREIKNVVIPSTSSIADQKLYVIATAELTYLQGQTKKDFYNVAAKPALAYPLEQGDIITISDNMIDGTSAVGEFVQPQDSSVKLKAYSSVQAGVKFIGKVIEKTTIYGGIPATVIEVKAN